MAPTDEPLHAPQHATCKQTRMLRAFHERLTVDQRALVSGRPLYVAARPRGKVLHEGRRRQLQVVDVDHVEIRVQALTNEATILDAEEPGRIVGQLANRLLQREMPPLVDPVPEEVGR